jgi:hypothetical protein
MSSTHTCMFRVVSEAQPAPSTFSVRAAGAHQVPRTPTTVRHLTALQTRQASQQLPPSSNNCASTEHVPQHETQQGAASSGAGAWGTGSQRPSHLNVRPVTSNTSADSEVSSYNSLSSSFRTGTSYTTSTSCRVSELPFMAQVIAGASRASTKVICLHKQGPASVHWEPQHMIILHSFCHHQCMLIEHAHVASHISIHNVPLHVLGTCRSS